MCRVFLWEDSNGGNSILPIFREDFISLTIFYIFEDPIDYFLIFIPIEFGRAKTFHWTIVCPKVKIQQIKCVLRLL